MRQASSTTLPTSEREEECDEVPAERNPESLRYNSLEDESSVRESIPLIVVTNSRNPSQRVAASRRTRQTWAGLACGIASVVLSALAIRPEIGMSLPASITGFAAIILGYLRLSSTSPRDHSPSTKWISSAMIASGVLGIFLGPLYFSGLGRGWRESSGQTLMRRHLNGNRTDPQVLDPLSTGDVDER